MIKLYKRKQTVCTFGVQRGTFLEWKLQEKLFSLAVFWLSPATNPLLNDKNTYFKPAIMHYVHFFKALV